MSEKYSNQRDTNEETVRTHSRHQGMLIVRIRGCPSCFPGPKRHNLEPMSTAPLTVLLVEDDANDTLLLERAFHRANLTSLLRVVTDAEQAMAYLDSEDPPPSLLLLDINLPRTSGLELLEWVRKKAAPLKDLPVIVLTSSRDTEDIDRAYALGANSYMAKPGGNFDGLAQMVKEFDRATSPKPRR